MYGGLFGDLPSSSKGGEESGGDDQAKQTSSALEAQQQQQPKLDASAPTKKPAMMFVPPQARRKGQKRPLPAPPKPKPPPPSASQSANTRTLQQNTDAAPTVVDAPNIVPKSKDTPNESAHLQNDPKKQSPSSTPPQTAPPSLPIASEPESLQRLHKAAKADPYDPHVPNDLLYYLEQQRVAAERQRLWELQQRSLAQQEVLRQQVAHERRQFLKGEGNVDKMVAQYSLSTTASGMGRGGVSNLPAWLIQKQKQQQQQQQQE